MDNKLVRFLLSLFVVVAFVASFFFFLKKDTNTEEVIVKAPLVLTKASQNTKSSKQLDLPKVSTSDWELILVNRDNKKEELNPAVAEVEGTLVDARITEVVSQFLTAARQISADEHLISGYRSVAYQEQLYEGYVQQEMATGLSREDAEKKVQTYSQPAGASEHQTGLAIDMSTVNSLNQSDPSVVAKVKELAVEYGFVLRFEENKTDSTGIGYEDWHYRYVGKESATYMTENQLSLEEYLDKLKEAGQ